MTASEPQGNPARQAPLPVSWARRPEHKPKDSGASLVRETRGGCHTRQPLSTGTPAVAASSPCHVGRHRPQEGDPARTGAPALQEAPPPPDACLGGGFLGIPQWPRAETAPHLGLFPTLLALARPLASPALGHSRVWVQGTLDHVPNEPGWEDLTAGPPGAPHSAAPTSSRKDFNGSSWISGPQTQGPIFRAPRGNSFLESGVTTPLAVPTTEPTGPK